MSATLFTLENVVAFLIDRAHQYFPETRPGGPHPALLAAAAHLVRNPPSPFETETVARLLIGFGEQFLGQGGYSAIGDAAQEIYSNEILARIEHGELEDQELMAATRALIADAQMLAATATKGGE